MNHTIDPLIQHIKIVNLQQCYQSYDITLHNWLCSISKSLILQQCYPVYDLCFVIRMMQCIKFSILQQFY